MSVEIADVSELQSSCSPWHWAKRAGRTNLLHRLTRIPAAIGSHIGHIYSSSLFFKLCHSCLERHEPLSEPCVPVQCKMLLRGNAQSGHSVVRHRSFHIDLLLVCRAILVLVSFFRTSVRCCSEATFNEDTLLFVICFRVSLKMSELRATTLVLATWLPRRADRPSRATV
jgi:hypothetical protein